ncbi:MAG: FAD-dependent oxidoreductase, partial [Myxococcota bacterium]
MRISHSTSLAVLVAVAAGCLTALASCNGSDDAGTTAVQLDSLSSATPGVPAAVLTDAHAGWKNPGCLADGCHTLAHGSKSPAGCIVCHGDNGAPRIPIRAAHDQEISSCASCHAAVHEGLGFDDPIDCTTCHKFAESDGCPTWREFDVAVIGAGGGGLSAAAALARAGKKVVVIEKHNKVGGYMTAFERKGYRFEVSLHGFDGLEPGGMNVDIFKQLGIYDRVKPVKTSIMYKAIYPDFSFDVPDDVDAYEAKLKEAFPDEADGIAAIFEESMFMEEFILAFSKSQAGEAPMPPQEDMLKFQEYSDMPLSTFLSKHISDPKLTMLYTQLAGFAGAEPDNLSTGFFMAMWNSYHRHGFHFFEGGSQAVSDAMADVVRENGGTVRLGTLATKVAVEGNNAVHVETQNDACYRAQHVVSNAPAPLLIHELIGTEHIASEDVEKYDNWKV